MTDITIEQALYGKGEGNIPRILARSPGFLDEWEPEAKRLCTGFGARPTGLACPGCLFAHPLNRGHVAVVQVADQGCAAAGSSGDLGFHLLVLSQESYAFLGGDPFHLAELFPPPWQARGELPALSLPAVPPVQRTVDQIQGQLAHFRNMQPTLLGSVQALVDGGRLVIERSEPDTELLRCLWMLLPTRTRSQLWPASFTFSNALAFDVLVVPRADSDEFAGYVSESQAADYPEGRYELALQVAAEAGDQAELDALFARRSQRDVWRMGLLLLGAVVFLTVVMNWLSPPPAPRQVPAKEVAPAETAPNHGAKPGHAAP
jgi:hypothetical protein